jgi:hypothetical protein
MPFDGRTFEQQDDVLDLLRRARERVARGWVQHIHEADGAFCIVGAVHREICDSLHRSAGWDLFGQITGELRRELPFGHWTKALPEYNDTPGRTQAEIVALFDAAIARREQEGGARG